MPLIPVTERPQNAETPLAELRHPVTPTDSFYRRNHFPIPEIDPAAWRLRVDGGAGEERALTLDELRALPRRTLRVTLECAGSGRTGMEPRPPGTPWGLGPASTGEFTGTPLREVLSSGMIPEGAAEILFRGADASEDGARAYERSLPLDVALHPDTLLAWEMNGEPLPAPYGFPLRVVVPGWYGMAAVKWLMEIRVLTEPFTGFYQAAEYVLLGEEGVPDGTPLSRMRVRSLITSPAAGDVVSTGDVDVQGVAWSGTGPVTGVDVSADGGESWHPAELEPASSPYAAQRWSHRWRPAAPGEHTLRARATDAAGNRQPLRPPWNRLGYGNNACHAVTVRVEG